jgi:hypothetical protein
LASLGYCGMDYKPALGRLIHPSAWRDCPKSLGPVRCVVLQVAERGFSAHFASRTQAKFTLGASLVPFSDSLYEKFVNKLGLGGYSTLLLNRGSIRAS